MGRGERNVAAGRKADGDGCMAGRVTTVKRSEIDIPSLVLTQPQDVAEIGGD